MQGDKKNQTVGGLGKVQEVDQERVSPAFTAEAPEHREVRGFHWNIEFDLLYHWIMSRSVAIQFT